MIVLHILIGIALVAGQETTKSTLEGESTRKAIGRPTEKYSPDESTQAGPKQIRSGQEEVKKENPKEAEVTQSTPAVETAKYNPPTGDNSTKSDVKPKSESDQTSQSIVGSMYKDEVKYGDLSPATRTHVVDPYKDKPWLYPEYRNPYFTPREEVEFEHRLHAYSADRGHHQRQPQRRLHTLRRSRSAAHRKSYTIHRDYAGMPLFPGVSRGLGYI